MAKPPVLWSGMAFGVEHYVPLLLTRRGERTALRETHDALKDQFTPLFVVHPIEWNFDLEALSKSVDVHLEGLPDELWKAWADRAAFIDLIFLEDEPMSTGVHPLVWLTDQANTLGMNLVPVVSPERTSAYRHAAALVASRDGRGACLRLSVNEWPSLSGTPVIDALLRELGVGPADVDLVLDLAHDVARTALTALAAELSTLPYLYDWRSLTVAGTGMPATMPAGKGMHVVERQEWHVYRDLLSGRRPPSRLPTFGDYVISSPEPGGDVDPRFMNISATLRYTTGDNWLIAKGGLFKGNGGKSLGGAAMRPVAASLLSHPDFIGAGHCALEDWVAGVAAGGNGGSPEVWRRYGTRHHLQAVIEQIASLSAPSGGGVPPSATP
jgi:hypothetical protein